MTESKTWNTLERDYRERLEAARPYVMDGKVVEAGDTVKLLEAVIRPGDKVNIEGDNQKQADFLAQCLCEVDIEKVHDLHMVQSVLSIPAHLDIFDKGIAKKVDFSFSGPQAGRLAEYVRDGKIELGATSSTSPRASRCAWVFRPTVTATFTPDSTQRIRRSSPRP